MQSVQMFDLVTAWQWPLLGLATILVPLLSLRYLLQSPPEPREILSTPNIATLEACLILKKQFPEIVIDAGSEGYWDYIKTYWAAQARAAKPALVVRPRNVQELSNVVKVLSKAVNNAKTNELVQLAIRGGGHSPNSGFANIEAGIVVDLSRFDSIDLAADKKTVSIGPGTSWGKVYRKLQSDGLAVAGGRASSVGVGGLTLGGGLSFFSPQVGFVCDAIVAFEAILADGRIVTASEKENPDLAIALRGGGNNFAIVTKFVARTFPQDKVWMGYVFHTPGSTQRLMQAFYDFCQGEGYDKKATCMFILSWAPYLPFYLPITCLNYTEPTPNPPALRGFSKERRFWNTLAVRSLAEATDVVESMSPANKQDLFHTMSFENNLEVLQFAHLAFKDSLNDIRKVSGMIWSLVFQPLVPSATVHHASNSMGINTDKTLTVMHVSIVWNSAKDAPTVHKAAERLVDRVTEHAKQKGVYHSYKYANYSSAVQDPYAGYGVDRQKFLHAVSRKYDPDGIFQRGVPGGHKLFRE